MEESVLVLCYGNPAREDDGLGPAFAELLEARALHKVTVEANYQLLVEDAVPVSQSSLVIFVDAAAAGKEPFEFGRIEPGDAGGYMAHSVGPAQLLSLARETLGRSPEAYLLAIRGYSFQMFREGLTSSASNNMREAVDFLTEYLRSRTVEASMMRRQR